MFITRRGGPLADGLWSSACGWSKVVCGWPKGSPPHLAVAVRWVRSRSTEACRVSIGRLLDPGLSVVQSSARLPRTKAFNPCFFPKKWACAVAGGSARVRECIVGGALWKHKWVWHNRGNVWDKMASSCAGGRTGWTQEIHLKKIHHRRSTSSSHSF